MMEEIIKEAEKAKLKFGPYNSTHEIYAVLKEELDEYWELVKLSKQNGKLKDDMIQELKQVSAVAYRAMMELKNGEILHV